MIVMWNLLPFSLGIFGGIAACLPLVRDVSWSRVVFAWAYLCIDIQIMIYARTLDGQHLNWLGKAASLLFAFAALYFFRLTPAESAVMLPRKNGVYWTFIGSIGAAAFSVWMNYIHRNHNIVTTESIVYEALLPGFAEELSYRGVAFGILLKAFPGRRAPGPVAAATIATSLTFALAHAFPFSFPGSPFQWSYFAFALVLGTWYALLRSVTGSVLVPAVSHNVANLLGLWASTLQ